LPNEFPNNLYYPALLGARGVEFVETPWERFWEEATAPRTRLVALSSVSYITGFRAPLEQIARELNQRGILFYVDGTQSVGALRMDVSAFEPGYFHEFDVSADGQRFLFIRAEPESRPTRLDVILNWLPELARTVGK
jgi:hypothetical protein